MLQSRLLTICPAAMDHAILFFEVLAERTIALAQIAKMLTPIRAIRPIWTIICGPFCNR